MMERNNAAIAARVQGWLVERGFWAE